MKLFVMRHGITEWNEKGITQGRSNNQLSINGIARTEIVANQFKDTKFDAIVCSPLKRTLQTTKIMNSYHNVKIFEDKNLTEIDQGVFSGRKKSELSKEELELKLAHSKECGMESYDEVYARVKNFVKTLKTKYNYENLLVVTHNCIATAIQKILNSETVNFNDRNSLNIFKNSEIKEFEI